MPRSIVESHAKQAGVQASTTQPSLQETSGNAHLGGDGLGVQGVDVLAGGQHVGVADGVTAGAGLHVLAVQGLNQGAQLVVLDHLWRRRATVHVR